MSDTTPDAHQEPDEATSGRDGGGQIPSADQDVASGQPYDPRQDPDTDADPLQEKAPAQEGVNQRDPAEGSDDESATDG